MASKYEEIYKDYQESGMKLKEYCEKNDLNYHNTIVGIYHYKTKQKSITDGIEIIKVKDDIEENNSLKFKINEVDCKIDYKNYEELRLIIKAIKNV